MSGFSFSGVYKAPIGTTSREASFARISSVRKVCKYYANHASAGKSIPTESNAISIFHLTPLVFQSIVIHGIGVRTRSSGKVTVGILFLILSIEMVETERQAAWNRHQIEASKTKRWADRRRKDHHASLKRVLHFHKEAFSIPTELRLQRKQN